MYWQNISNLMNKKNDFKITNAHKHKIQKSFQKSLLTLKASIFFIAI